MWKNWYDCLLHREVWWGLKQWAYFAQAKFLQSIFLGTKQVLQNFVFFITGSTFVDLYLLYIGHLSISHIILFRCSSFSYQQFGAQAYKFIVKFLTMIFFSSTLRPCLQCYYVQNFYIFVSKWIILFEYINIFLYLDLHQRWDTYIFLLLF